MTRKRTIPYGLSCLAAVLMKDGFSVQIFDALATPRFRAVALPQEMGFLRRYYCATDRSPFGLFYQYRHFGYAFEHIGRIARRSEAFLVGIASLFTPYADDALRTAEAVRTCHPDCKIVLGGHHPTVMPMRALENPAVDFVILGEGEKPLLMLARALRSGSFTGSIPGIVTRHHVDRQLNTVPQFLESLDDLPLPAMHLIDTDYYRRGQGNSIALVTSRGCPMTCSYCAVGAGGYIPYRRRSMASVLAEIDLATSRFDIGFVEFEDENLSLDRTWFIRFLRELTDRFGGSVELRAMNGLLPTTLDDEVVCAMKAAGFKTLNLSLGSSSKEQLKQFHRPDVRYAFDHAVDLSEKYGLDAVGYVIAAGPNQKALDSVGDLLFFAQRRVLAALSIFYPAPGSIDYERCDRLGILPEHLSLMRSTAFPLSHTTTRREAVTLLRLCRILNFMKFLTDEGINIPVPEPAREVVDEVKNRSELGLRLLSWFFWDGKIRGVTSDGAVYEHEISTALSRIFIEGLRRITLRGVTLRQASTA